MTVFSAKKRCDRCGALPAAGRLFRIPWTGDRLCKDCIDKDRSLQQMFAEIESMAYGRRLHDLGIRTGRSDESDMPLYLMEQDDQ